MLIAINSKAQLNIVGSAYQRFVVFALSPMHTQA
jgi:hypothetical protein